MEELSLITEIRAAITEELSISDNVRKKADEIRKKILAELSMAETNKLDDAGIFTKEGNFHTEFMGATISVSFTYYNFKNKKILKDSEGKLDYSSCFSAKIGKNFWFMKIRCHGVSGGINLSELSDSIQHEVEHVYQGEMGSMQLITPSAEYATISNGLASQDEDIRRIAEVLYVAYKSEQDAFVNGLYAALISAEIPMPRWEDIKNSEIYSWLIKTKDNIEYLEGHLHDDDSRDKCRNIYHERLSRVVELAKKAYDRMKRKIAKILIKVRKDYSETHPPVLINHKSEILPYFDV